MHEYFSVGNIEDSLSFEVVPLQNYLTEYKEKVTSPHTQDFYQIIWYKSGCGVHMVDFHTYEVFENAIFFIAKNQVHSFSCEKEGEGFVINFDESFLVQKDDDVDFFLKCNLFNNPYQNPSCCVGSGWEYKLDEYIRQMQVEISEKKSYGKEELLRLYLKAFLIQVQRRKHQLEELESGVNPFPVDEKRNLLVQFINAVDENFTDGLTVSQYADLLYISPRTLSNLTLQLLQKRPVQVIQERIILEAKRLLLHSELTVKEIADRIGFDDPAYFVRYFKKHTRLTPTSFRKSVR